MFLKRKQKIGGLIRFYSLEEWWLSSFTEQEQKYIESRCQSMGSLTKGDFEISLTKTEFLSSMVSWFKSKPDLSIAERIRRKLVEVGEREPVIKLGYFKGRHFSTYPMDVEALMGEGKLIEAETLLLNLVDTTESESKAKYSGVAPWFYEKLAILYRKQKDYVKEVEILERFSKQKHAPGVKPQKLIERLIKAKELLKSKI